MDIEMTAGLVCRFCGADAICVFDSSPCYNCGKDPEYTDAQWFTGQHSPYGS